MPKFHLTSSFIFQLARYDVADGLGDAAVLEVDYRHNKYTIESKGGVLHQDFRDELANIARDLLRRKHNINFVTGDTSHKDASPPS